MQPKTIGVVGYGAFGSLVAKLIARFAPGVVTKIYDSRRKADKKRFFALSEVAGCDVVVITVPISAFEEALKRVVPLMKKDAIIVDVATVKVHTVNLLKKIAKGRRYIATHPMWGPESYVRCKGNVNGFRIVISKHTLPKSTYTQLRKRLESWGFVVVEMNERKHDQHLAKTLFLTHFLSQTITRAGFDRTKIDTVSFGFLMDAVETVRNNVRLFRDVYRYNPFCKMTLRKFKFAEKQVLKMLERA